MRQEVVAMTIIILINVSLLNFKRFNCVIVFVYVLFQITKMVQGFQEKITQIFVSNFKREGEKHLKSSNKLTEINHVRGLGHTGSKKHLMIVMKPWKPSTARTVIMRLINSDLRLTERIIGFKFKSPKCSNIL